MCIRDRHLADRQGTIRDLISSDGILANHVSYDSFGTVLSESNSLLGDRYRFTGRELNESLSNYYYRARIYDPALGRFTSLDPIEFEAGDSNLYRYVFNSPQNGTDPSGEATASAYALQVKVNALKIINKVVDLVGKPRGGMFYESMVTIAAAIEDALERSSG